MANVLVVAASMPIRPHLATRALQAHFLPQVPLLARHVQLDGPMLIQILPALARVVLL